jgi:hypothetical protein
MNRLFAELQRLYLPHAAQAQDPGATPAALPLLDAGGCVRTLVIAFRQAGDWDRVSGLWQGVQQDFELPAPAISVCGGEAAYRMWFSLAEAVPVQQACTFLQGLCARYLSGIVPAHLTLFPGPDAVRGQPSAPLTPALDAATGRWSAFIDPGMGGLFVDEPWLELAPNPDKQAELLARLRSIDTADFQRVQALLVTADDRERVPAADDPAGSLAGSPTGALSGAQHEAGGLHAPCRDPRAFLLAVMNDPGVSLALRIEAARALLPGSAAGA